MPIKEKIKVVSDALKDDKLDSAKKEFIEKMKGKSLFSKNLAEGAAEGAVKGAVKKGAEEGAKKLVKKEAAKNFAKGVGRAALDSRTWLILGAADLAKDFYFKNKEDKRKEEEYKMSRDQYLNSIGRKYKEG